MAIRHFQFLGLTTNSAITHDADSVLSALGPNESLNSSHQSNRSSLASLWWLCWGTVGKLMPLSLFSVNKEEPRAILKGPWKQIVAAKLTNFVLLFLNQKWVFFFSALLFFKTKITNFFEMILLPWIFYLFYSLPLYFPHCVAPFFKKKKQHVFRFWLSFMNS